MNKKIAISLSILLFIPLIAGAASFGTGEEYSLGKDEVLNGNLYVAGGNVSIQGMINGDFIAAGNTVIISGIVGDDATIVGGTVNILSTVGGDVRAAGGNILIGDNIGGDLILAGGSINILTDSFIGEDIIIAGGQIVFEGSTNGSVKIVGGDIKINGEIDGDVYIEGDKIAIGGNTIISGNLKYRSPEEATIEETANLQGEVIFEASRRNRGEGAEVFLGILGAFWLWKLSVVLVLAILGTVLLKKFSSGMITHSLDKFGTSFLTGLITIIVIPFITILLFISVIGILLGAVSTLLYIAAMIVSGAYSGIVLGSLIQSYFSEEKPESVDWKTATLGVLLLSIIGVVPVVGWVVKFVFMSVALGSLVYIINTKLWKARG